eukprot:TRINITY_DN25850_c0_g1_i1.p1 TRINITY_DN25850_c0_g1~~TRINITY_DN25850_c0_g1_i1.p1  ORF type:complete len:102 (-),score=8.57 TRINITY_DN25850_c0_g1_i1:323-628(-)
MCLTWISVRSPRLLPFSLSLSLSLPPLTLVLLFSLSLSVNSTALSTLTTPHMHLMSTCDPVPQPSYTYHMLKGNRECDIIVVYRCPFNIVIFILSTCGRER